MEAIPDHLAALLWYHGHCAWLIEQHGSCWHDPAGAAPARANLTGAHLSGADLTGADLSTALLNEAYLPRADLTGANLIRANLRDAILKSADLTKANLEGADLTEANLWGANLSTASLNEADLPRADLTRANLRDANLRAADLTKANLEGANFTGADLTGANLLLADLIKANLEGAKLERANLSRANLTEANLEGANLIHADLAEANLRGANLTNANLTGANLHHAILIGANLTGANLIHAHRKGASLRGANLTNANLIGANLTGAKRLRLAHSLELGYEAAMASPAPQIPFGPELRVFVDTSALMEPGAERSFEWLAPELKRHGLKAIVPQRVIDELKKMTGARGALAAEGLRILERLQHAGVLDIKGENDDGYVDNLFQAVFVRFRLKYSLLLITQDRALAQDVLSLSDANAVQRIRGIFAARVAAGGFQAWTPGEADRARPVRVPGPNGPSAAPAAAATYKLVPQLPALEPVKSVPGLGEQVVDSAGKTHRLAKLLGTGGEGSAFLTDSGVVCKVYRQDRLFLTRLEKLELMAKNPVKHPAVCWPTSVVRRPDGRVGYLMSPARGRELQKSVFVKPLLMQHFPGWRKVNLVQLAISVLEPIAQLNSTGVLLGDINPRNILVGSDSEIYLVDTDSYQFMGHPCTVGMPPFLAPDLYGKPLDATLRSPDHEAFAVSTLVFMLMLPGKPPYSHQGGEDPAKNVKAGNFPYAVGDRKGKAVPEGPWRYQWSHLPRYMKEELDGVFTRGRPLGAAAWLEILGRYRNDLSRGNVSNELFPTALKQLNHAQTLKAGGRWVPCSSCGKEFGLFESHPQPLCNACKAKRVVEKAARDAAAVPPPVRPRPPSRPAPPVAPPPRAATHRSPPPTPPPPPPSRPVSADPFTAVIKWIASLFG